RLAVSGGRRLAVPAGRSVRLLRGEVVRVTALGRSLSGYLALEGGFDLPLQLGSASTYVRGGIGGLHGRVLQRGDLLPLAGPDAQIRPEKELAAAYDYGYSQAIRVVLGPQDDYFTPQAGQDLLSGRYVVSDKADRMGFRLDGPALQHAGGYDLV